MLTNPAVSFLSTVIPFFKNWLIDRSWYYGTKQPFQGHEDVAMPQKRHSFSLETHAWLLEDKNRLNVTTVFYAEITSASQHHQPSSLLLHKDLSEHRFIITHWDETGKSSVVFEVITQVLPPQVRLPLKAGSRHTMLSFIHMISWIPHPVYILFMHCPHSNSPLG